MMSVKCCMQGWLVGPSEIIDVDPELLDPDARPGWGNAPSGWVPGMVLIGCIVLLI